MWFEFYVLLPHSHPRNPCRPAIGLHRLGLVPGRLSKGYWVPNNLRLSDQWSEDTTMTIQLMASCLFLFFLAGFVQTNSNLEKVSDFQRGWDRVQRWSLGSCSKIPPSARLVRLWPMLPPSEPFFASPQSFFTSMVFLELNMVRTREPFYCGPFFPSSPGRGCLDIPPATHQYASELGLRHGL